MNVEQRYLAESGGSDDESLATRSSLLDRLRDAGDQASWQTFFDTYWRLIYNVARKSGLDDPDAQDVVQEAVIAVARRMPEFRYDPAKGSFKSWLLLITRRRIHDHFRRRYRLSFAAPRETEERVNPSQDLCRRQPTGSFASTRACHGCSARRNPGLGPGLAGRR